jgi:predicted dehydrogenase
MLDRARSAGVPGMIDFNFPELATWQRARAILQGGEIGRLRHVVVTWNVENQSTRLRLKSWKTRGDNGGGILGNFVSHCFYYLEWFCGPIAGFTGRITPLPGTDDQDCTVALALAFGSGAGGSLQMSCASFLGSGHRIEFYGEDGTVVLANPTGDYFRGFELKVAQRSDPALRLVDVAEMETDPSSDSRIAPVAQLLRRFLDACSGGAASAPGLAEGYRVQQLIDAARRAHATGRWIDITPPQDQP